MFPLLRDLLARKMLPAIVFHMDTQGCDKFAKILLDELVRQEEYQRSVTVPLSVLLLLLLWLLLCSSPYGVQFDRGLERKAG